MKIKLYKDTMRYVNSLKLKIPINVGKAEDGDSGCYDYSNMFNYVRKFGFIPEPYLSSSKFSLRAGQNNWDRFCEYSKLFFKFKEEGILPGLIHLVFNSRMLGEDIKSEIKKTFDFLTKEIGFEGSDLNFIISDPLLISRYVNLGFNVTVSSASISTYKRVIDILSPSTIISDPSPKALSYVLPSTYKSVIPSLPSNSFELLVNNGCFLKCRNAGVLTDHTENCPIRKFARKLPFADFKEKFYDSPFQKLTDVIPHWEFMDLQRKGWKSFKISGRQAEPSLIFKVVKYYLREDTIPYIDSPISYGNSSNG